MSSVHVERLTLAIAGLTPEGGRRLAELVALGLSRLDLRVDRVAVPRLSVRLDVQPGITVDTLARRILKELAGQLQAGGTPE